MHCTTRELNLVRGWARPGDGGHGVRNEKSKLMLMMDGEARVEVELDLSGPVPGLVR